MWYPDVRAARVTAKVVSVEVRVRLNVQIWTASESGPEIMKHEDTHRMIAEHFCTVGEELAKQLCTPLLGKELSAPGANRSAVLLKELNELSAPVVGAWVREITERCHFAQDRFDAITQHGIDPIPTEKAMAQALADEAARPRDDAE